MTFCKPIMSELRLKVSVVMCSLALVACGGDETKLTVEADDTSTQVTTEVESENQVDNTFATFESTNRFLQQATFGASYSEIEQLAQTSASEWFKQQITSSPSFVLPHVKALTPSNEDDESAIDLYIESTSFGFWKNSITASDQLRQRVAFALSEILVVSNGEGEELTDIPEAVASYQDILLEHAFGNYRELLEAVTYSPAMGQYLTYLGSQKGNEATGRMPDENYARELLQLFTIGVVELNQDGTPQKDAQGDNIETYDNFDVTGLARVFTGLNLDEEAIEISAGAAFSRPLWLFAEDHSEKEKTFLDFTINAGTQGKESISLALDHIFAHQNVAPFVTKQLIQRLVTSNPTPEYVARVADTFEQGIYRLPDGSAVGDQRRGNLTAVIAAILFDQEARQVATNSGGKIREPILRFTHWARAFNVENITPEYQWLMWDTSSAGKLSQHPYRSPSVFNFFRPGYSAPGSITSEQGLVAPELQITHASSIPGYINFMTYYVMGQQQEIDVDELQAEYDEQGIMLSAVEAKKSFLVNYQTQLAFANDAGQLVEHLNMLLVAGQLSSATKQRMVNTINLIPLEEDDDALARVKLAVLMVMTSPDYLVQK